MTMLTSRPVIFFTLFTLFTLCCCVTARAADGTPPQRSVTEKRLVQIDFSRLIPELFVVSPDSQHVAYGARAEQKQVVIVDGQAGKPYQAILGGTLRFSPDSKRLAYGIQQDRQSFLVVDGKAYKSYAALGAGTLQFSPDSQRLAYVVVTDARMRVVVDATEHPPYSAIVAESLTFSPNGRVRGLFGVVDDNTHP